MDRVVSQQIKCKELQVELRKVIEILDIDHDVSSVYIIEFKCELHTYSIC